MYVATAFAVVQAADVMLPRMGVPEWVTNLVVALAVLGLPIALVLAWALELTPDGVRVTRSATAGSGDPAQPALLSGRTRCWSGMKPCFECWLESRGSIASQSP